MKYVISVISMLGVAFVVLRLCDVITWHWAWVLAPFWAPIALIAADILLDLMAINILMNFLKKINFFDRY